ncbi:hypothetical protein [Candidatus Hodarchaeum mangrovi]
MKRNLESQMRLSLRAILSKQMTGGSDSHLVIASFISDENGFPLTGLKRSNESIVDMEDTEFEQLSAVIPQIWENVRPVLSGVMNFDSNNNEINHLIIGVKKQGKEKANIELMITRLEELFISSLYYAKKR